MVLFEWAQVNGEWSMLFRQLMRNFHAQHYDVFRYPYYADSLKNTTETTASLLTVRLESAVEHWSSLFLSVFTSSLMLNSQYANPIWMAPISYMTSRMMQMMLKTRLVAVDSGDIDLPDFNKVNTAVNSGDVDAVFGELCDLNESILQHNMAFDSALGVLFASAFVAIGPWALSVYSEPTLIMTGFSAFASLWCGHLGQALGAGCHTHFCALFP
jgi:hypothetical protein